MSLQEDKNDFSGLFSAASFLAALLENVCFLCVSCRTSATILIPSRVSFFCFSLYDIGRNHVCWWCFLMWHTGFYEGLSFCEFLTGSSQQFLRKKHQNKSVIHIQWLAVSIHVMIFKRQQLEQVLVCHTAMALLAFLYFETHWRTEGQTLAVFSISHPKIQTVSHGII